MEALWQNGDAFRWVILPLLIFCARVMDVTIGTMRIIFVSKGSRWLAPLLGFCEVIIWLLAMSQIMRNINNTACYLAYGGGFAVGTFVGISLEERLAVGYLVLRIVTAREAGSLISALAEANYGVTCVDARGSLGPVKLIYTVIKRKDLQNVSALIADFDPKAFYSVEEARKAKDGVFPVGKAVGRISYRA